MKFHCELDASRLKKTPIRDEGEITGYETHWLITVKVPADRIDANETAKFADQFLYCELQSAQGGLKV